MTARLDESHPTARRLRIGTIVALALVGLQVVLGGALSAQITALQHVHAAVAYALLLATIACAVLAFQRSKVTGNKGIFFHAVSLPVLMLAQIALGELEITIVHMVLGLAIAVGIGALYAMAAKAPEGLGADEGDPDLDDLDD